MSINVISIVPPDVTAEQENGAWIPVAADGDRLFQVPACVAKGKGMPALESHPSLKGAVHQDITPMEVLTLTPPVHSQVMNLLRPLLGE